MSFKIIDDTQPQAPNTSTDSGDFLVDDVTDKENLAVTEMDTFLGTTPIAPISPKKPLHDIKAPNQDNVEEGSENKDFTQPNEEGHTTFLGDTFNSVLSGATDVMASTAQGIEDVLVDSAGWLNDTKAKTILEVGSMLGIGDEDSLTKAINAIDSHPSSDNIHDKLAIADHINTALGMHVFANLSEMKDWSRQQEESIDNPDKITFNEFVNGTAKTGAYIASMVGELGQFKYGKQLLNLKLNTSFGNIFKSSFASGLSGGITEMGKEHLEDGTYSGIDVSAHVVTDTLFGLALGSVIKGGAFAHENWYVGDHFKPDTAYKAVESLEREATKIQGKDFVSNIKDKFLEGSKFKDWDAVPNYLKASLLGSLSPQGKSMWGAMARDKDVSQYLHLHIADVDKAITEQLNKVTKITGKDADSSEKVLTTILQDAGLLGSKVTHSGKAPRSVPRGKDYDILRLIMEGVSTKDQQQAVGDTVKVLTNSLKSMRAELASNLDKAGKGVRVSGTVNSKSFIDNVLLGFIKRQKITDPDLLNNPESRKARYEDLYYLLHEAGAKAFRATEADADGGLEFNVTPARLYDLISELPSAIKTHKGNNQGFDEKLGIHLKDSLVDMVDLLAGGANYKEVLHNAANIHLKRSELLEKTGLDALAKNPHTLSDTDVSQMMYNIFAKGGQKAYDELLASVPKKHQELMESQIIRSLVYGGNKDLEMYSRALMDSTSIAGDVNTKIRNATNLIDKNSNLLQSFVPKTLKGRQLQEFVVKSQQGIESLVKDVLPVNSGLITYKSDIGRGIGENIKKIWGSVQSHENAVRNTPYMLASIEKAYKIADGQPLTSHTVSSVNKYLQNSAIDLGKFPHSVTLINMIKNLNNLKAPDVPFTEAPSTPSSPTPSTRLPNSPSPVMPLPKEKGQATEVLSDIAIGGQIGNHRLITPAYDHLLKDYQKKLVQEILSVNDVSKTGFKGATANPDDPVSAIDATSELWIKQNKYLLKMQKGEKNILIKGIDGSPRLIFGENALKFKGDILKVIKAPSKTPKPMYEYIDMTEYNNIATALGHPDMFKGLKILFDTKKTIGSGGIQRTKNAIIKVGVKNKTKITSQEIRQYIAGTLVHELQHRVQQITKMPSGANSIEGVAHARMYGENAKKVKWVGDQRLEYGRKGFNDLTLEGGYITYRQSMGEVESRFAQELFQVVSQPNQDLTESMENLFNHFIMINHDTLHRLWTTNPNYKQLLEGVKSTQP